MEVSATATPFWSRFYVRLAAVFLLLLLGLGAALIALAASASERATAAADQALHRDLAAELAPRFQPHLREGIDDAAIAEIIGGLTQVNRRLDVYLLGSNGMIKKGFMDARRRALIPTVDTAPMERFLAGDMLPILGVDPARPEVQRPFSVANVSIMGEEGCYLYLILQGERYDDVAGAVRRDALASTALRGVGLAFGGTALVGLLLFGLLTRRLRQLTAAVGAFERGAHGVRADARGTDEVAELGRTFNGMAERLAEQLDQLRATDNRRRELIANVSHDLRSPLAALRGYLETLQLMGERLGAEDRDRYRRRALYSAERLSVLVSDLFDLARFDAAEVPFRPEPTALADLAHDVGAAYAERADTSGVALHVRAQDALPLVHADAELVERALTNLLDNAVRHTASGGHVYVDVVRADGSAVALTVRDTGEGIAPAVLPRVFERGVRAEESRPADEGAGLGLAIVKRIAALHGGSVHVESVLGKGATFTLHLPIEKAAKIQRSKVLLDEVRAETRV